jgi:hypothetical protein
MDASDKGIAETESPPHPCPASIESKRWQKKDHNPARLVTRATASKPGRPRSAIGDRNRRFGEGGLMIGGIVRRMTVDPPSLPLQEAVPFFSVI